MLFRNISLRRRLLCTSTSASAHHRTFFQAALARSSGVTDTPEASPSTTIIRHFHSFHTCTPLQARHHGSSSIPGTSAVALKHHATVARPPIIARFRSSQRFCNEGCHVNASISDVQHTLWNIQASHHGPQR
jgi:hypothetical protein